MGLSTLETSAFAGAGFGRCGFSKPGSRQAKALFGTVRPGQMSCFAGRGRFGSPAVRWTRCGWSALAGSDFCCSVRGERICKSLVYIWARFASGPGRPSFWDYERVRDVDGDIISGSFVGVRSEVFAALGVWGPRDLAFWLWRVAAFARVRFLSFNCFLSSYFR